MVAVDNGSTDDSLRILEQRTAQLPMTVVSEPRRGKNTALNAGLAFIEGDIVALTDDDVILPPDWLVAIDKAAASNPDHDIFGGAIAPVWEVPPPDWVLNCVPKGWLSLTEFPEGPIEPQSVFGPNMAVRAAVFRQLKFAEDTGPDGTVHTVGSETEFTMRAERSGHRCWHFHASPVGHIIRPYQLSPEWLLQRAYNFGRGNRRMFRIRVNEDGSLQAFRRPMRHKLGFARGVGHLAAAFCRLMASRLFGGFENQFRASLRWRYSQGDLAERYASERDRWR